MMESFGFWEKILRLYSRSHSRLSSRIATRWTKIEGKL